MLLTKNLDTPDETRSFELGELSVVSLGGVTFARAAFRPGWRWSKDMKPLAGTDSCQVTHQAVVVSGRLRVKMDSGEEPGAGRRRHTCRRSGPRRLGRG